jgi:predicted TIM-barrel fold metal-dependent hydrolase
VWGNDFPHSAGDWPNSRRVIDDICAGLPEDEKKRILGGNAAEFFRLT